MVTQFTMYMESEVRRELSVSVHPNRSAHAYCSAYADEAPILSLSHAGIAVTVSPPERSAVGAVDVRFAQDLADAANTYLAEVTRLYTEQSGQTDADSSAVVA